VGHVGVRRRHPIGRIILRMLRTDPDVVRVRNGRSTAVCCL